ncbi:HSP20-like chaperone [Podospora didyma]|uniref:HSP20-like chaperone n=1 Tax=Podospora didyma TaxID=330526 RepID=A0AAE0U0H2_9PEZI|nr:HSP20-like chaperone [Podospora didyma]
MVFAFPQDLSVTDPNFTTLFRLLDDFNAYSQEAKNDNGEAGKSYGRHRRGPRPRFDIRETPEAYELYGEVPGVERKDVHIELTEPNVIMISGHVERPYDDPKPSKKKKMQPKVSECECPDDKTCDKCEKEKKSEGASEESKEGSTVRYLQRERFVGDFSRDFAFPGPLQEFEITASLENGILKVVAPKQQPSKGRRIEIQ